MGDSELPYRAEYAKSGRAGCKLCHAPIAKDSLRLAVMVQSPFFDGKQPKWHHFSCFFGKFRPKTTTDIAHFENLRWNDQESIKNKIEGLLTGKATSVETTEKSKNGKSKKRSSHQANGIPDIGDYTIEYAKSKRSKCKVCEEFIDKDEIRISKKDYESEVALSYGPTERWHHVDCFLKAREELGFFGPASVLPGFKALSPDDQKTLKSKIPEIQKVDTTDGPSPPKKSKEADKDKEKMKKQNELIFKYRDQLEVLTKAELITLLKHNRQDIPEGVSRMLDRLSDAMAFGALSRCEKCKGQFIFRSGVGYQCLGDISEWSKCQAISMKPSRVPFKVPDELKEEYSFLNKYKAKVGERLFTQSSSLSSPPPSSSSSSSASTSTSTKSSSEKNVPILSTLKFLIHKTESKTADDIRKQIENLGGSVVKKMDESIIAVISTENELKKSKLAKCLKEAKDSDVHVLPENFFDEIKSTTSREELIAQLNGKKISSWGSDLSKKIKEVNDSKKSTVNKSVYPNKSERFKSNETVKKITLKDGLVVDPESELDKVAHVYRRGDDIYSVVLSLADVQTGRNSYYKLQIIESDKKNKYWLFRAWGRIGTTIGGNKCEQYETLNDCIELFKELFEEKTGNAWKLRKQFKKVAGKMMMLDVQYKDESKEIESAVSKERVASKILSKPVQDLITLIFDVEAMKKTMLEFELDLNKMPLGKISQKQIQSAFGILSELQNLISSVAEKHMIIDKTNMFYTLVPHDCGINVPPILDSEEIIKQKIDMLNSLMEIEIAYNMLQDCESNENSYDDYYKKLNADIVELDPKSDEFKIIETYVKNTHAKTHMNYTLEIENVFKVERSGEARRFKKFSKLSNRKLLWHGSRITNFAGILSQGLRIAPPEAPTTGYMFGKGVYFSDMVSKSANYCNTSKKSPTGLLLLCEVALGEMLELTQADYIEKLPKGKSSVKGVGKTHPDPSEVVISPTGAEVPIGKGIEANIKDSSLLYNEYIVYDVAQIKIQYLLRLKFNYKI